MPSRAPHDFLLEASERISRASTIDTENDGWLEEEAHPSRVVRPIRFRRRAGLEGALLTRTYNGRPHIPGEDSGSEMENDGSTNMGQNSPVPSDRSMADVPYSDTSLVRPSLYETILPDPPTRLVSTSLANLQSQPLDGQTGHRPRTSQTLQNDASLQTGRAGNDLITASSQDQSGPAFIPSYGTNRSGTPIRARRAPPRPQFAYNTEETINRAAVFERRLERALREYRTVRRAWATLSNPHASLLDNETLTRTTTFTPAAAQATATSMENEEIEPNSVQDILRSARRRQSSTEDLTMLNSHTQQEMGRSSRYRGSPPSSQSDTPWWRQEPESRSYYRAPGPDDSSSTNSSLNYDGRLRDHQSSRALYLTNTQPPISSYSRSSYRNHGSDRTDRLHHFAQRTSYGSSSFLMSGSFSDNLTESHPSNNYDFLHRSNSPVPASALPGPDTDHVSRRNVVQNAKSARNRNDHRNLQKPKAVLRFLAGLRDDLLTREQAWDLAKSLRIHNQSVEQDAQTDLVMSIDETPPVEYTSWLEPGVTWTGSQYADHSDGHDMTPTMIQDHLSVKVVLHSVDWNKMTLTGTMAANQPQRKKSTESFFIGEIIDFRTHGLDTCCSRWPRRHTSYDMNHNDSGRWGLDGTCQDLEMDLLHWPMLGPFKRDVDRALSAYQTENQQYKSCCDSNRPNHTSRATNDQDAAGEQTNRNEDTRFRSSEDLEKESLPHRGLTADEVASIRLNKISRLLSSAQWLKNNLNQAGWILMRWKEQCFMPSTTNQSSGMIEGLSQDIRLHSTRSRRSQQVWTTVQSERENLNPTSNGLEASATRNNNAWGLSIDGFYYVALNRQTGEIEALYHDPGSVFYQKLEIKPSSSSEELGVRTNFSLVEIR